MARGANADSDSEEESSSEEEKSEESGSGSEDESSSEDENKKKKGVSGLIEIENPNRVRRKAVEKVPEKLEAAAGPSSSAKPELSRREREELEKQRATAKYQKMHSEGKTDEARADLARLAIIKQHRAEAQARREQDKKGKL